STRRATATSRRRSTCKRRCRRRERSRWRQATRTSFRDRCCSARRPAIPSHIRTCRSMSGSDGFGGLRVLSLESRRSADMSKLLAAHGGVPLVVPALVERTRGASAEALAFAAQLAAGDLSAVIFLTGTGTRMLATAIEAVLPRAALAGALNRIAVVARGPKPYAA